MLELKYEVNLTDILDTDNVAEILNEDDLKSIGFTAVENYKKDADSRSEWEERNEKALDLALQVVEPKNTPWQGAANVKYPLLSTAALQFAARAYPALIPGPNVVKGRVNGYDFDGTKTMKSIRVSKHMSYQVFEEMEDWEEEMDKLCMTLPILGLAFKKTYYDELIGKNRSELIMPQDLVVDYWTKSLEDAQRITHVFELSQNDIYERQAVGSYMDVELVKEDSHDEDPEKTRSGIHNTNSYGTPYTMLEMHTSIDLDGDGYEEPYVITVHLESETVVRIIKRYDEESIMLDQSDNVIRIKGDEYFTKFGFIPSPDGSFYDIGFGTLLGPINNTVNTLINQLLDAGTLSNMQGGFISKGIRLKGGTYRFSPGEWKTVNSTGMDLKQGIFPLPIREPSNVLYSLLSTMVTAGEKLSSVTDMMSGEIPGQNTKATVATLAIEQGMKVFNSIYKRIHRSLKKEFKKLYNLNAKYLADADYFNMLDLGMPAPISRHDYASGDIDIIPYSDPNIATEAQKLNKLEAIGQLLQLGTIDPMEYTRRYIEATEQPNGEALIAQPKGPDPELVLKQEESKRKQFEAQTKAQIEQAKVQIAARLAESKVSKEEIDSIVNMLSVGLDAEKAKQEVEQTKQEAKVEKSDS